jgi:hypothetical protein
VIEVPLGEVFGLSLAATLGMRRLDVAGGVEDELEQRAPREGIAVAVGQPGPDRSSTRGRRVSAGPA